EDALRPEPVAPADDRNLRVRDAVAVSDVDATGLELHDLLLRQVVDGHEPADAADPDARCGLPSREVRDDLRADDARHDRARLAEGALLGAAADVELRHERVQVEERLGWLPPQARGIRLDRAAHE